MKINGIEITEDNRATEYVMPSDKEGMRILGSWHQWFCDTGIESEVHLTKYGYAVYRLGLLPIEA